MWYNKLLSLLSKFSIYNIYSQSIIHNQLFTINMILYKRRLYKRRLKKFYIKGEKNGRYSKKNKWIF